MSKAEWETPVAASFVWASTPAGRVLVCQPLSSLASHAFTTRDAAFLGESATDNWESLGRLLAIDPRALIRVTQVHGRAVVVAREAQAANEEMPADAIVSLDPSQGAAIRVADCVPILLADRSQRVVAAIHAGWRGTAAGVARATVDAIRDAGVDPATLVAALGPSIGPCCYEVGDDVRNTFLSVTPDAASWFTESGPARWRLDLWEANAAQLEAAGLDVRAIHVARWCTADHPADCFSYRRDGPGTGRMVAAIRIGGRASA